MRLEEATQHAGRLQEANQALAEERDALSQQLSHQRYIEAQHAAQSLEEARAAAAQLQAQNAQFLDERGQLLHALAAARQQLQQQVRQPHYLSWRCPACN